MATATPRGLESQCNPDHPEHSPLPSLDCIATLIQYIRSRWPESLSNEVGKLISSIISPRPCFNMPAPSQAFDTMPISAAQAASTADLKPHPRASCRFTDRGPTPIGRAKMRAVKICKSAAEPFKNLFGRRKTPEISPSSVHTETLEMLEGSRPNVVKTVIAAPFHTPSASSTPDIRNIDQVPVTDGYRAGKTHLSVHEAAGAQKQKTNRGTVMFAHPTTDSVYGPPPTPATASTISFATLNPIKPDQVVGHADSMGPTSPPVADTEMFRNLWCRNRRSGLNGLPDETLDEFIERLDGDGKARTALQPTKRVSTYVANKPVEFRPCRAQDELCNVPSEPPSMPPLCPISTRISGFGDYRSTYHEGMFLKQLAKLAKIPEAADGDEIQSRRGTTHATLASSSTQAHEISASQTLSSKEQGCAKTKKPAYYSTHLPDADYPRIYQAFDRSSNLPLGVFGDGTPCSSLAALATDHETSATRPSTAATSVFTVDFPMTPGNERHSKFYTTIEQGATFSPRFPPTRSGNPEPPAAPAPAGFLETVYKNPPLPPAQPGKVSVPPRKPVPKTSTAVSSKAHTEKPLPPSPTPHSARRFTPIPKSRLGYPPCTEPPNNPVAGPTGLHPAAAVHGRVASPYRMNQDGYPLHDARRRADFTAAPGYSPRGPMNEMERKAREHDLKRETSRRAAEAKVGAEKARAKKLGREERGAKKLCNLQ